MNFLLDTCTFLWLALEPKRLSPAARDFINDQSNVLFLGDVSLWEIVLKHTAGKLPIPARPDVWLPPQIHHWQLQPLAITPSSIYRSGALPKIHQDPFDRLLAASALEFGLTILSPDTPLSQLGASRLW